MQARVLGAARVQDELDVDLLAHVDADARVLEAQRQRRARHRRPVQQIARPVVQVDQLRVHAVAVSIRFDLVNVAGSAWSAPQNAIRKRPEAQL